MSANDPRDACARETEFPRAPVNRPGLPRIERRIGTYPSIRAHLLERLNREPALSRWTHRGADDPGIALLEGAAMVADVLTFYQELYANEAYLRTASWRESVSALVRLLGYRLAPGIGGRGTFAFEVRGDGPVTVPAGFPLTAQLATSDVPSDFQTAEPVVAWPGLGTFPLSRPLATPGVTSETRELVVATDVPGLDLKPGQRLLVGSGGTAADWHRAEVAVVEAVRERHGQTVVTIKGALWATVPAAQLVAYRIGRSWRHFGHAAPPTSTVVKDGAASTVAVDPWRSVGAATDSSGGHPYLAAADIPLDASVNDLPAGTTVICQLRTEPVVRASGSRPNRGQRIAVERATAMRASTASAVADASAEMPFIEAGSVGGAVAAQVLQPIGGSGRSEEFASRIEDRAIQVRFIAGIPRTAARRVRVVSQATLTWGSMTGPSTVVTLESPVSPDASDAADISTISIHEATSPLLALTALPQPTDAARGRELGFTGTEAEAATLVGRRLLLVPPSGSPAVVSVVRHIPSPVPVDPAARRLRMLALDAEVDYAGFDPDRPSVVAHGNVVDATQGKAEREEAIGSGDARATFQTMPLPKTPLTFLTVPGATPPAVPELEVFVAGRRWRRVASLFGTGARDEVYVVIVDDEGRSWVGFGDGRTGSRLPSGVDNVVVRYRTGAGAFGPLRPGASVQAGARLDGLDAVTFPGVVSGGDEPETADSARVAAPGTVQALGRLVSIRDYETEALAIPGVARARAAWRLVDNVPSTVVTVLLARGREREFADVRGVLGAADRLRGATRYPVIVAEGRRVAFRVRLAVAVDDSVRTADADRSIREALRAGGLVEGEDGTAGRGFGDAVFATRLESLAQAVPGVRWARVDAIARVPDTVTGAVALGPVGGLRVGRGVLQLGGGRRSEVLSEIAQGRVHVPLRHASSAAPGPAPRLLHAGPDEILALDSGDLEIGIGVAGPAEGVR